MTERSSLDGRLILSSLLASVFLGILLIVAATFGFISPKPTLDIMAIICGSIVCGVAAWRFVRQLQRRTPSSD